MNPLLQLLEYGQSFWLDNLARPMIEGGELKRRIAEQGLRGVTSNPKIFKDAITGSDAYRAQIDELSAAGRSVNEIYDALVVTDVQNACDVLRPVSDESEGVDGYVSLEVSPRLAHDAEGTIADARRYFKAVDRPNVLIKIPGSPACVPAIEQCLYEGININITLLFSVESYEAVANAYLKALGRRAAEGKPLRPVASVASFFLSRIDTLVDQLLGHRFGVRATGPRAEDLIGKAAVANAKLAYQSFKNLFSGKAWEDLEKNGARPQRVLWASTSTKDKRYKDVYYVEPLIGPHTINTMPDQTVKAFADHGKVALTIEQGLDEARQFFVDLERAGIDFSSVTWQLLNEGVQKFIDPFDELLAAIAEESGKAARPAGRAAARG
jgi:transaldolase